MLIRTETAQVGQIVLDVRVSLTRIPRTLKYIPKGNKVVEGTIISVDTIRGTVMVQFPDGLLRRDTQYIDIKE